MMFQLDAWVASRNASSSTACGYGRHGLTTGYSARSSATPPATRCAQGHLRRSGTPRGEPPIANASAAVPVAPTPASAAPDGFCAVARIARPAQVRVSTRYSTESTTAAAAKPNTCVFGSDTELTRKDSSKYDGAADR